jgi:hypothetical protein
MSIPPAFRGFVDDAAIFPPGSLPLDQAVPAHAGHRAAPHADLVGSFVIAGDDLERTDDLAAGDHRGGLAVSVVVASPDAVEPVIGSVRSAANLRLVGLEVKLVAGARQPEQVDEIAARTAELGPEVAVFVEVPRSGSAAWPGILVGLGDRRLAAKLRTGGTSADAFPGAAEVATWIHDIVAAGLPFKCTAGLHRAVRHTDTRTGFVHHGYLNLLLATLLARRGADVDQVRAAVDLRDEPAVVDQLRGYGEAERVAARASFRSYGSCSIAEPYEDLRRLGQLAPGSTSEGAQS